MVDSIENIVCECRFHPIVHHTYTVYDTHTSHYMYIADILSYQQVFILLKQLFRTSWNIIENCVSFSLIILFLFFSPKHFVTITNWKKIDLL